MVIYYAYIIIQSSHSYVAAVFSTNNSVMKGKHKYMKSNVQGVSSYSF